MGLMDDLGIELKRPNALQRAIQKLASSRPGAWLFSKILHPMDKLLLKTSGGRLTVPELLAALPVIMVTTTGAKTGVERTMPLVGIPVRDELALIGTNFGQRPTPGWVYNLEANPSAAVTYRSNTVAVSARPADGTEGEEVFAAAAGIYGGYAKYRARIDHRPIRVFILERAA